MLCWLELVLTRLPTVLHVLRAQESQSKLLDLFGAHMHCFVSLDQGNHIHK